MPESNPAFKKPGEALVGRQILGTPVRRSHRAKMSEVSPHSQDGNSACQQAIDVGTARCASRTRASCRVDHTERRRPNRPSDGSDQANDGYRMDRRLLTIKLRQAFVSW